VVNIPGRVWANVLVVPMTATMSGPARVGRGSHTAAGRSSAPSSPHSCCPRPPDRSLGLAVMSIIAAMASGQGGGSDESEPGGGAEWAVGDPGLRPPPARGQPALLRAEPPAGRATSGGSPAPAARRPPLGVGRQLHRSPRHHTGARPGERSLPRTASRPRKPPRRHAFLGSLERAGEAVRATSAARSLNGRRGPRRPPGVPGWRSPRER
jgi:hypothetical protein